MNSLINTSTLDMAKRTLDTLAYPYTVKVLGSITDSSNKEHVIRRLQYDNNIIREFYIIDYTSRLLDKIVSEEFTTNNEPEEELICRYRW
jgi:hypothetical protein